jgi:hypothetical protein
MCCHHHRSEQNYDLFYAAVGFQYKCQTSLVKFVCLITLIICIVWTSDVFIYSMREDVFKTLVTARDKFGDSLEPEAKRYLERLIKLGQRNGESK